MKILLIGADPFPPYQYIGNEGNIEGSDYQTIKKVVEEMGYEANFLIDEWSVIENKLILKEIDIAFQVQKTPEREKKYFFSEKLRDAVTSIASHKENVSENKISNLLENEDKLGVIRNYKYGSPVDEIEDGKKEFFDSLEELLESIESKKTAFGVVDLGVYNYIDEKRQYRNIKLLRQMDFNRPLYVVFSDKILRDGFNSKYIIDK